ncbi:head completion protein [Desulfovibrio sp. X2]|uniref:head completion/stabilization protein n=1 Tax=Desulfovibrio sp. X2 TaxID=941449 RepID=UPI0003587642|nr:head completion/stabilization protein [Desulfovibrio sp. X2]EPR43131.1 head completion protein [Desulfovibrio sp. X2]
MSFNALPDTASTATITGDGWYPDLAVAEFQSVYRLPAEFAEALVIDHLTLAMMWAARQLASWRAEREAEGMAALADIPYAGLSGGAVLVWKRAVYCHAKALLLGQFATMDRREAARNEAKEAPETADRYLAWAHDAIADLLGNGRIAVELV